MGLRKIPNYNRLYVFHRVVEAGSIKAAAHEIGVEVPTLYEHLTKLRLEMGDDLYHIVDHVFCTTERGQTIAEIVKPAFIILDSVYNLKGAKRGNV